MERVRGVGGVFFKARDPKALAEWYRDHLGIPVAEGQTCAAFESAGVWPEASPSVIHLNSDLPGPNRGPHHGRSP